MIDNYVYIVESPSAADLAEGRAEGHALCKTLELSGKKHSYSLAVSKLEFLKALAINSPDSKFMKEFARHKGAPILHLSMHGNDQGIQLTDLTVIEWAELREILSPINDALPDGLMVTFSTCGGAASIRMSMSEDINCKPFYATVGSFSTIPWDDALVGYVAFYHNWFKNKDLAECVEIMKRASDHAGFVVYSGPKQKQDFIEFAQRQRLIEALTRPPVLGAMAPGGLAGLLTPQG